MYDIRMKYVIDLNRLNRRQSILRKSNDAQYSSGNCNFEKLSAGPGFGELVGNTQAPIYIFEHLDIKDLVSLAFANKTMYKMVFNSMYNRNNRLIQSLDLYFCYLKYMIDFKFDNSNKEYFLILCIKPVHRILSYLSVVFVRSQ